MWTAGVGGLGWMHRPYLEETVIDLVETIHDLNQGRGCSVFLGVKTARAQYR